MPFGLPVLRGETYFTHQEQNRSHGQATRDVLNQRPEGWDLLARPTLQVKPERVMAIASRVLSPPCCRVADKLNSLLGNLTQAKKKCMNAQSMNSRGTV